MSLARLSRSCLQGSLSNCFQRLPALQGIVRTSEDVGWKSLLKMIFINQRKRGGYLILYRKSLFLPAKQQWEHRPWSSRFKSAII